MFCQLKLHFTVYIFPPILGWLFNTFTVSDEYTHHDRENLPLPLQMQLFKKYKTFYSIFEIFFEFRENDNNKKNTMA